MLKPVKKILTSTNEVKIGDIVFVQGYDTNSYLKDTLRRLYYIDKYTVTNIDPHTNKIQVFSELRNSTMGFYSVNSFVKIENIDNYLNNKTHNHPLTKIFK